MVVRRKYDCGVYPVYIPRVRSQLSPPMKTLAGPPPMRVVKGPSTPVLALVPAATKEPPSYDAAKHDHRRDVKLFPALRFARNEALVRLDGEQARRQLASPVASPQRTHWQEEPVWVGLALTVTPPVGLAMLWSSPRFDLIARVVLTLLTLAWLALIVTWSMHVIRT
ncbi:MAG: hypothetical protein U0165_16975 [Polyangiaceae bacterium]